MDPRISKVIPPPEWTKSIKYDKNSPYFEHFPEPEPPFDSTLELWAWLNESDSDVDELWWGDEETVDAIEGAH